MASASTNPLLSVLVPVYNERENLPLLLDRLTASLSQNNRPYEVILIDDRSKDASFAYLKMQASVDPRIRVYGKQGAQGKSFSLLEGIGYAKGDLIAFIDADLQYPPEALPAMAELMASCDIVVANRVSHDTPLHRRILSRTFRFIFGSLLLGLKADVQSGLKMFKREAIAELDIEPTPWGFDYQFLFKAKRRGAVIKQHDIVFSSRQHGVSHISSFSAGKELALGAIKLRFASLTERTL